MLVIYFRDTDGTIANCQAAPEGKTKEDINGFIQNFNKHNGVSRSAHIAELAPNSLEEFLFKKMVEKKKLKQEVIEAIVEALDEAMYLAEKLNDER